MTNCTPLVVTAKDRIPRTAAPTNMRCATLMGVIGLLIAVPALAHHSYGMFDMRESLTLVGTVREFQWTNPHCFIQLWVPDGKSLAEWSVEMSSVAVLYRQGWRPGTEPTTPKRPSQLGPVRLVV